MKKIESKSNLTFTRAIIYVIITILTLCLSTKSHAQKKGVYVVTAIDSVSKPDTVILTLSNVSWKIAVPNDRTIYVGKEITIANVRSKGNRIKAKKIN